MNEEFQSSDAFRALREKAAKIVNERQTALPDADAAELLRLFEELEIQRGELELQNEELRCANKALEASRNELADLYQSAPIAILTLNGRGIIEQANEAAVDLLGAELTYRSFSSLLVPGDREIYSSYLAGLSEGISTGPRDLRLLKTDGGGVVSVQLKAAVPSDEPDALHRVRLSLIDITRRKKAEAALKESEAKMSAIFRAAPAGIGVVSDRVILEVNRRFCELTGYSADELIGQNARMLYPSDEDYEFVGREKYRQIERHGIGTVETRLQRKDGRIIDVLLGSTPLDRDELSQGIVFSAIDITARKQAENILRESEEKFSKAFYSSPSLLFICEFETGIFVDVNHAYCAITGYRREEMIGRSSLELGLLSKAARDKIIRRIRTEGRVQAIELQITAKNGETHFCLFSAETMRYRGTHCLIYSGVDLTERQLAEDARKRSEESLRLVVEGGNLGTWDRDLRTGTMVWNERLYRLLGRRPDARTLGAETFFEYIHAEDLPRVNRHLEEVLQNGEEFMDEFRVVREDGEVRWLGAHGRIYRDSAGEPIRMAGVHYDITERKKAEAVLQKYRKTLEAEVAARTAEIEKQYQQLEEMNRAVTQMAQHTIRTMENDRMALSKEIHDSVGGSLAAIKMLLETRLQHAGRPPENIPTLETIVGHITDTIKESKRISHQLRPMALDDFGLTAAIVENIRKFKEFYPDVKVVHSIRISHDTVPEEIKTAVYRVIQEALNNIGKHSRADSAEIELTDSEDEILLRVEDSGIGFDPSITFSGNRRLQAYGLRSMKERVEICRGSFAVESTPGRGTRLLAAFPKGLR